MANVGTISGGGEDRLREVIGGGSTAKAVAGAAVVVLAILGLAQIYPYITLSIATIALGTALLLEGAAVAATHRELESRPGSSWTLTEGFSSESFAGAAAIVLGILGLVGEVPIVLSAVAAIVVGGALALARGLPSGLAHGAAADAGSPGLVGLGAVVLGILALVGIAPPMLTLVALLVLGFAMLLSGAVVGEETLSAVGH